MRNTFDRITATDTPAKQDGSLSSANTSLFKDAYDRPACLSKKETGTSKVLDKESLASLGRSLTDASQASQEILKLCVICELKYPRGIYVQVQDNYQQLVSPESTIKLIPLKSPYQKKLLQENLTDLQKSLSELQTQLAKTPDTTNLSDMHKARAQNAWSKAKESTQNAVEQCQKLSYLLEHNQLDSKQISRAALYSFDALHDAKKQQIKLKKALGFREGLLGDIKSFALDIVFAKGLSRFIPIKLNN